MEGIVKVQTDMSGKKILVYNKDYSIHYEQNIDKEGIKELGGPMSKKYFKCKVVNKILELGDEVEEQDF